MIERRLVNYSYFACALLAIGSVAPWDSGPTGYIGVTGYGLLSLLATMVAALAVWRWTMTAHPRNLTVAIASALFSVAVAVYAAYEIRDFYLGADGSWMARVGWGVILTLIAAMALVALCVRQQRGPDQA